MVCIANDLLEWKDFPKGLRVLLLDEDINSASEIKSKLEEMEYIVYAFVNEDEALSAILSKSESFHVAIVEVSIHNNNGRYKFLESAKDLPTIMTSKEHCLNTMMKCIALGAVEFLVKPISEDKLRNVWQHVVHKAFNAGRNSTSESLKSIKEFVGSVMEIQQQNITSQNHDQSSVSDGDSQDQTDMISPVKSDDTTYGDLVVKMEIDLVEIIEEDDHGDASKGTTDNSSPLSDDSNKQDAIDLAINMGNSDKLSTPQNVCGAKGNRKKAKVDWTPELHKKFVQAVEKLGVDQAIPTRILELMKVEGLTRHNIASHLQKYRMQRRHILPKEDNRRNYYPHVMAFPPYHINHTLPPGQVYPHFPVWTPLSYPSWQPADTWHWKPFPRMHADAWGCPVMPPTPCRSSTFPQGAYRFLSPDNTDHYRKISTDPHHLGEEAVDKVVMEAISKPWLPLPIGLKPPSIDSVLDELSRQGISTEPPYINGHRSF